MPITKKEAINLTPREQRALDQLETYVDDILRTKYHPNLGTPVTIDYRDLEFVLDGIPFDIRLQHALADLYKQAGWKVNEGEERGGGSFIQFN